MRRNLVAAVATCLLSAVACAEEPALKSDRTIPLPGVEGRFDHAAADPATNRLFFAALGNNSLEVVDVLHGSRLHTIAGLKKPTGVVFDPQLNLLIIANGDDGTCRFHDGTTYGEKGRISGLEDADNVRFDSKANRLYVGFGDGALAVIDPKAGKLVGRIALKAHPESFQLEENGPRVFVNVPDAHQVAVIDRDAGKVVSTWSLDEYHANFPMALDEAGGRLFIGCRQPARLLVIDTNSGKRIADSPLSGDTDDLFYQPTTRTVMASCGEGFVDVINVRDGVPSMHRQFMKTAAGARTSYLIRKLGLLCLAVPHRGGQAAEIRVYSAQSQDRRQAVP